MTVLKSGHKVFQHPCSLLLATDGEEHSLRAEEWSFNLATTLDIPLTILHVQDPYLKQFYNEIYAQGRREYLEHVDTELESIARDLKQRLESTAHQAGIPCSFIVRNGDPLTEIVAEVRHGDYDLIIVGGKRLSGIKAFRSWNLPARPARQIGTVSIMTVRSAR